jgi:hypothetical protein
MDARPTGYLNSSQVAGVNHLEPARADAETFKPQRPLAEVTPCESSGQRDC